jgi:hypothetical protein
MAILPPCFEYAHCDASTKNPNNSDNNLDSLNTVQPGPGQGKNTKAPAWDMIVWFGLPPPCRTLGLSVVSMAFKRFLNTFMRIPCLIIRTGRRICFRRDVTYSFTAFQIDYTAH